MKVRCVKRWLYDWVLRGLLYVCGIVTCILLGIMIIYVFWRGLGGITWELLTSQRSFINETDGIFPNLLNTIYIILVFVSS